MSKSATEHIGARLPAELIDLARELGQGNISAGLRLALERYNHRRPTQAEIAAAIRTLAQMQEADYEPS